MPTRSYGRSSRSRGQRGTLHTLPDGRTQARYRDNQGKRPQQTFDSRADAAEWLRERLGELDDPRAQRRRQQQGRTVDRAVTDFLAAHAAADSTLRTLSTQLGQFTHRFGDRPLDSLEPYELAAWRKTLSPGYAHYVFRAVRQLYRQAVAWDWVETSPAEGVKNPRPNRREVQPPPWEQVLLVDDEIDERYIGLPVFVAGTGLRVEEWVAMPRDHVDLVNRVIRVRWAYSSGELVELGPDGRKTSRQRRDVPMRQVVATALARIIPRIDTPLLFPAPEGGYLNGDRFRNHFWIPACRAAGLATRFDHRRTGKEAKRSWAGWRADFAPKTSATCTRQSRSRQESTCSPSRGGWARR
jgi:site-specific recombinase XerD